MVSQGIACYDSVKKIMVGKRSLADARNRAQHHMDGIYLVTMEMWRRYKEAKMEIKTLCSKVRNLEKRAMPPPPPPSPKTTEKACMTDPDRPTPERVVGDDAIIVHTLPNSTGPGAPNRRPTVVVGEKDPPDDRGSSECAADFPSSSDRGQEGTGIGYHDMGPGRPAGRPQKRRGTSAPLTADRAAPKEATKKGRGRRARPPLAEAILLTVPEGDEEVMTEAMAEVRGKVSLNDLASPRSKLDEQGRGVLFLVSPILTAERRPTRWRLR